MDGGWASLAKFQRLGSLDFFVLGAGKFCTQPQRTLTGRWCLLYSMLDG